MGAMAPGPETILPEPADKKARAGLESWLPTARDTGVAIVLALGVGAFLIAISDDRVIEALNNIVAHPGSFFVYLGDAVRYSFEAVVEAYWALLKGAVGSWSSRWRSRSCRPPGARRPPSDPAPRGSRS